MGFWMSAAGCSSHLFALGLTPLFCLDDAGGTVIIGDAAADAYHTGKGSVLIRAKVSTARHHPSAPCQCRLGCSLEHSGAPRMF